MEKQTSDYQIQHLNNYKNAILELIQNNTNRFVQDDVVPLFSKPPLDSMDVIKVKFLSLAKKYHFLLDTEVLEDLLNTYRAHVLKQIDRLADKRKEEYQLVVSSFQGEGRNATIKLSSKKTKEVSKTFLSSFQEMLASSVKDLLLSKCSSCISKKKTSSLDSLEDTFYQECRSFLEEKYLSQMVSIISLKLSFRDHVLINTIKEQAERYLFTKKNSYLLNEK